MADLLGGCSIFQGGCNFSLGGCFACSGGVAPPPTPTVDPPMILFSFCLIVFFCVNLLLLL